MTGSVIFKVVIDSPPSPLLSMEEPLDPVLVLELCLWPATWSETAGQKLAKLLEEALRKQGAAPWGHERSHRTLYYSGALEWEVQTISVTADPAFDAATAVELLRALFEATADYRSQQPPLPNRDIAELAQHYVANRLLLVPDDQQISSFSKGEDGNWIIKLRDKESGAAFVALYTPDVTARGFSLVTAVP